ncbi:MAG: UDP-N-acetylmuramate--L-alanine ligase [Bacteroidota bacterium]
MKLADLKHIYFIGIGGIGMSALARYFHSKGVYVSGYDKTATPLTQQLQSEGICVHFEENIAALPKEIDLVVFTPAVPASHAELVFLKEKGFTVVKRAELLGMLTRETICIAVGGTHGKTTTSTLIAHLFNNSSLGCNAILGGISKNYGTNLILSEESLFMITEADEFDRSFLKLFPEMAVITSTDADHLDIYGTDKKIKEAYSAFAGQVKTGGAVVQRFGLDLDTAHDKKVRFFTYGFEEGADFRAVNLRILNHRHHFDLNSPFGTIEDLVPGNPGLINVENAVAALSIGLLAGIPADNMKESLASYQGVVRRLDIRIEREDLVYIDDYAHHPEELRASISSVRELYPDIPMCGVFQPHLFTRTRDFADEFAKSLDLLDDIILLNIYPARELQIPGISAQMLLEKIKNPNKCIVNDNELLPLLDQKRPRLLMTLGAGDIDQFVPQITRQFTTNLNSNGGTDVA